MKIKQYEVWIADLSPRFGTEPGKTRPVIVLQTDLLNDIHPSTIISPITTNIQPDSEILRIYLEKGIANLNEDCDIMLDQIRTIDNRKLIKRLGKIPIDKIETVKINLISILDLFE
jgi:mRNA interferase MazF